MEEKIEEILEKVKETWSGETQIGFSELAMQDAIKLALAHKKIKSGGIKIMEKDIGKINKGEYQGAVTEIVLRIDDFADKRGLTIREFVTSDRYTGFTKSGVRILAADFPKFKEMINSITEEDMKEEVKKEVPEECLEGEKSGELPDY